MVVPKNNATDGFIRRAALPITGTFSRFCSLSRTRLWVGVTEQDKKRINGRWQRQAFIAQGYRDALVGSEIT